MDYKKEKKVVSDILKSTQFTVRHWICEKCKTHNHISRSKCLECGNRIPKNIAKTKMHKGGGFTHGE